MKTDHPIYLFLSAGAEAFRLLTVAHRLEGAYRFCSLTINLETAVERPPGCNLIPIWAWCLARHNEAE